MHQADHAPRFLNAAATALALPFPALVEEVRRAAIELDQGLIVCPERLVVPLADGAVLLSMPAVAADILTHKLITVTPNNKLRGVPTIRGQVSVIDPHHGGILMTLDGPTVTGRRTAAISMLGLQALHPGSPRAILLIGTGAQARQHVEALAVLHPMVRILVRGSSPQVAQNFCRDNAALHPALHPALSAQVSGAVGAVDVVISCTTSRVPVYVEPAQVGRLVIGVGAFQATAAEIAADTVRASQVVVDDLAGAKHEAGDLLLAGVDWAGVSSLGHVLQHGCPAGKPVVFKSVGCAAWDLAAARLALKRA